MFALKNKLLILLAFIVAFIGCASPVDQTITTGDSKIASDAIRISAPGANANEPAIAAGGDGAIFLVWVEHKTKKECDVMFRAFDSSASPKGEPVRVNPQPNQATAWRGDQPTIKVGPDGAIYIGWTERIPVEKGAANILNLSVSRDGGLNFDAPVKVNDDTLPASHGMHSLAVDAGGRVYFAWLDERYLNSKKEKASLDEGFRFERAAFFNHKEEVEPNAELYFSVSNDGGKTFAANKKLVGDVCPCCKTTLLAGADGKIYASWRQVLTGDFRHIAVAASTDNGSSFSSPVIVSDDKWQINACPVSGAALASGADNSLLISWFTAGEAGKRGLYMAESKDGGKTFSPRVLASESAISGTPLLLADEKKIVWADVEKIFTATLQKGNLNIENKREIGEGYLPAAAVSNGKTFLVYTKNEKEASSVWLSIMEK